MRRLLIVTAALCTASTLHAQDLAIQGGMLKVKDKNENTFTGALTYTQPLAKYLAVSTSYINEGHPTDHHRDGLAAQVWLRTPGESQGWSFGVGGGQYYYFDTATQTDGYTNDHSWASIYSVQATYHYDSRWYNQIQLNRILPQGKDATTSLLFGLGYRFDGVRGDKLHLDGPSTDDTLTALVGQGINNSLDSERSTIGALEYRRAIGRYVDWTVTALSEGNTPQTRRNGVATQLWLIRSLATRVEMGVGLGPYFNVTVPEAEGQRSHKAGLLTIASRYHVAKRVVAEVSWSRVITDYHRDADMLLMGLGYSF